MLLKDSDAMKARWSELAALGLEEATVIAAAGDSDYQGEGAYLVKPSEGWRDDEYVFFEWSYGSCSGCDGYEDMGEQERIATFVNGRVVYNRTTLAAWADLLRTEIDDERDWDTLKRSVLVTAIDAELAAPQETD